jgi:hypothetical protein
MREFWTPAEDAQLRALHDEGKSFTQMAKAIGRTKGSCISRSRKLKLPSRTDLHIKRMSQRTTKIRKARSVPVRVITHRKSERKPPMYFRVVTAPDSKPVSLMERTGCCYPTTKDGPHLFCNAPINGPDYCEFHLNIMYPRRRAA